MQKLLFFGILAIAAGLKVMGQTDAPRLSIKADLFGPVASMPSNAYFRFSPEAEYRFGDNRTWGITLDYERYVARKKYEDASLTFLAGDLWTGDDIRRESSLRIGARKYFGNSAKLFAEVQAGFSFSSNDTILNHLISQPEMYSKKSSPEFRMRGGYQILLSKRIAFDWIVELDPMRLVEQQRWNRVIMPELNSGFQANLEKQ